MEMLNTVFTYIIENPVQSWFLVTGAIGTASVAVKALAPLTKWTWDDRVAKTLGFTLTVLKKISLNMDNDKLEIVVKRK